MNNNEQSRKNFNNFLENSYNSENSRRPTNFEEWTEFAVNKGLDIKNYWNEIPENFKNFELFSKCISY